MRQPNQTSLLGVFPDAETAARATASLRGANLAPEDYQVLSGVPYPEAAFGEAPVRHRLYAFPLLGALLGFAVGLLFTAGTQLSNPLVTGGKPILSIPPMAIITYEATLLGAIVFTVLGIILESRLLRRRGPYDRRITEGFLGVLVSCRAGEVAMVEGLLGEAGAVEIKRDSSLEG